MHKKIALIGFLIGLSWLLSSPDDTKLSQILKEAGTNRSQFQIVLNHYSQKDEDSLKYRAAKFLIKNIQGHYFYFGDDVGRYYNKIDSVLSIGNPCLIKDILPSIYLEKKLLHRIDDLNNITSDFLICHIDAAFQTRDYPWCQHVPFEDFCNFVLPYRVANEPPENWIPFYQQHLYPAIQSLINSGVTSDSAVCDYISHYLTNHPPDYHINYLAYIDFKPSWYIKTLSQYSIGTCRDLTLLGIYTLRALGLPVAWDFTPRWANRSMGHDWNALLTHRQTIPFAVKDSRSFGQHLTSRTYDRFSKVYRKMFSHQSESLGMQIWLDEEIPAFFRDRNITDVTDTYCECADITVSLTRAPLAPKQVAYIMTFDNQGWFPMHWGRIRNKKATFTKMGKGNLYIVMYYEQGVFVPASQPFFLDKRGNMTVLQPDKNTTQTVFLQRKYPNHNVTFVLDRFKGGLFQGANQPDFSDAFNICRIDSLDDLIPQEIMLDQPINCRFFRYVSPLNGFVNMAEIQLQNSDGNLIKGSVIGTLASDKNREKSMAFDGNSLTYFNAQDTLGAWIGLSFFKRQSIQCISFIPRTDHNYIEKGNQYELFYYDYGWISLGIKEGKQSGGKILYNEVPTNALLWLRNLTTGKEERIFIYEKQEQIWL